MGEYPFYPAPVNLALKIKGWVDVVKEHVVKEVEGE